MPAVSSTSLLTELGAVPLGERSLASLEGREQMAALGTPICPINATAMSTGPNQGSMW